MTSFITRRSRGWFARRRGGWRRASWLALACGGVHPGAASPPPFVPAAPPGATSAPVIAGQGWSFENGLDGWVLESGVPQPVCGDVSAERAAAARGAPLVTLQPPGDYWRTPVDVGADGRCRLDTWADQPTPTVLRSPPFTVRSPFLSLRVGGGGSSGTAIRLEAVDGGAAPSFSEQGTGSPAMREVVWDLRALQGRSLRLAVIDDATHGGGLLVDALRFVDVRPVAHPPPLWGFADLHAHALSELAFGGNMFHGGVDGPLETALGPCDATHGLGGLGVVHGRSGPLMAFFERSHDGRPGHLTSGSPGFEGWPRWTTQAHQQMHVDWIRRAWQGGLRLLVSHAVNNEELATQFRGTRPFDDQAAALAQLDAMQALAARHADFMAVADSPSQAREIIEGGRLALVLGVEVDALGMCRRDTDCTADAARAAIDALYQHGARHIFPIHLADNAFGGSAVYRSLFNQLSWFLRDTWQSVRSDAAVDVSLHEMPRDLPDWVAHLPILENLYHHRALFPSYAEVPRGHVNQRGLTALGQQVVDYMMSKGILVDIDHMSQSARHDTLEIAARRHAPVAMGHTWFRDLGYTLDQTDDSEKLRNEVMKTAEEVEAVRALGGIIAPITNQGDIRRDAGSGVTTECGGSSSSWLQAYAYAVQHLPGQGVGVGTDFNGLAEEPLPRFGPAACLGRAKHGGAADGRRRAPGRSMDQTLRDDADAQDGGVSYATPLADAHESRFLVASKSKPYASDDVPLWVALAAAESGQDPARLGLSGDERALVKDVIAGLADAQPEPSRSWRHAAFLVRSGASEPAGPALLRQRYERLSPIYRQWQRMKAGNDAAPLERHRAGARDFDYNLDGLAHYGLLPDFLQDVSNQLRRARGPVRDLRALFQSAESYVATWERTVAQAR